MTNMLTQLVPAGKKKNSVEKETRRDEINATMKNFFPSPPLLLGVLSSLAPVNPATRFGEWSHVLLLLSVSL